MTKTIDQDQLFTDYDVLIGADEVGIGDFFGGIVCVAVCIKRRFK